MEQTVVGPYSAIGPPAGQRLGIELPPRFGLIAGVSIPAGEKDYTVRDSFTLPVDVDAFAVSAHAHYIGKSMKLTATLPSGETKLLLWIKDWDFGWQDGYFFQDFVSLPKGARLDSEVTWDNSAANPRNPTKPPVKVDWGEASFEEMGSVTLSVSPRTVEEGAALSQALREKESKDIQAAYARDPELRKRVQAITTNQSAVFVAGEKAA